MPQFLRRAVLVALSAACAVSAVQAQETVDPSTLGPGDIIASLEADFDGDGHGDVAALTVGEETDRTNILILSGGEASESLAVWDIGWRGGMWGTEPFLELGPQGSLMISWQNGAIGPGRWTETLTIAYRDDNFYVAGYTFLLLDQVNDLDIDCDVNLFTGSAVLNGAPERTEPRRIRLSDWSEESRPEICVLD